MILTSMGTNALRAAAVLSLAALFGGLVEAGPAEPGALAATVHGYIWTAESKPVPNGVVRLRDIATGRVRETAT